MADIRSAKENTVGLDTVTDIERQSTTKITSLQKEGLDAIPDENFLEQFDENKDATDKN